MPRYFRYLLIWLSCTAVSVTAVVMTVHFVVGSTRTKPPMARSVPTLFPSPSPSVSESKARSSAKPPRKAEVRDPPPRPSPSSTASGKPTPPPSPEPSVSKGDFQERTQGPDPSPSNCGEEGARTHTFQSQGGQVSVRFVSGGVCLVSAVPTRGFTVRTAQSEPERLTVTFSGERHRSEVTARSEPQTGIAVREASW